MATANRKIKVKKPKVRIVSKVELPKPKKKKKKVDYVAALEQVRKLAAYFGFDVDDARRLLFKKFTTVTLGDVGENHVDMEHVGTPATHGYSMEMMAFLKERLEALGAVCESVNLNEGLVGTQYEGQGDPAQVLVVRGGVNAILQNPYGADELEQEVDKDATIEEAVRMIGEGNYYYDESCGIGAHGDAERWKAIGIRLGLCAPLGYRWRLRGKGVGKKMVFKFEHGDMYIMSEKAVGRFWKRRASLQLVHAAGAEKYMKQLDK